MTRTPFAKILIVDDDPQGLETLKLLFEGNYQTLAAASGPVAIAMAGEHSDLAAIVMDIKMEGMDGITAARQIKTILSNTAIIFHTGYPGDYEERGIDSTEKPFDYVEKGCSSLRLKRAVRNGVDAYYLKVTGRLDASEGSSNFGLIGQSQSILKVIREIAKVAPCDNKVMIFGETGTGKELVARAIHAESFRSQKPLAILHCNHKSPDLVETELFGHKKGAFTTAVADRMGLFEYGNGGTVFLDEIGDLDITTQSKLLRVLESGEYVRIGDPSVHKTNVRILCATHKNLEEMVRQQTFREDLYYRLKGVQIALPPLRERREDIPLLVEHFFKKYSRDKGQPAKIIDDSAMDFLIRYDWPGNVRQLLDTIESVLLLTDSDFIDSRDVEAYLDKNAGNGQTSASHQGLTDRLEAYKRTLVVHALRISAGNISAAAELLSVDKSNLRKYVIDNGLQ